MINYVMTKMSFKLHPDCDVDKLRSTIRDYSLMSHVNEPKQIFSDMYKLTILQLHDIINDHSDAICDTADNPTL